jgi:hypothetical protein
MSKFPIIIPAATGSFLLSYYLNPLNAFLEQSMQGVFFFSIKISPYLALTVGRMALLFALITFPAVFIKLPQPKCSFFTVGLIFGITVLLGGLVRSFSFEKAEIIQAAWHLILPLCLLPYLVVGFFGGAIWTSIGKKIIFS